MTVQIDVGPGAETRRSSKFAATVNGTSAYVYDYGRASTQNCRIWSAGDEHPQSWFNYGTDEVTTVVVSLVAGSITTANVYPDDIDYSESIAGGTLTLTVPINTRMRVEVNGDETECLHIFASPTQVAPGDFTDYTTLAQAVTTVSTVVGDGSLTVTGHGWGTAGEFFRGIIKSSDSLLPGMRTGTLTEFEAVVVFVSDENTVRLIDQEGVLCTYNETGSGLTITPASWSNDTTALYFPPGEHNISRAFELDGTVYVDAGAVVTGSFNVENSLLSSILGPGNISGEFATWEQVTDRPAIQRRLYSMVYDSYEDPYGDVTVSGPTFFANPYYLAWSAGSLWRNVQSISCWTGNTDGIGPAPVSTTDRTTVVQDCFVFGGDDIFKTRQTYSSKTIAGCFGITTANTVYHGAYFSSTQEVDPQYTSSVTNCYAMHLGRADGDGSLPLYANCILRSMIDGSAEETLGGHFNVTIDGIRAMGTIACRLFMLGNWPYIWQSSPSRDQYGQLHTWRIANVVSVEAPGQLSAITAKDSANTPYNIEFEGLLIGGNAVDDSNYDTYASVSQYVYNLTFGPVDPGSLPDSFIVEDGSGVASANSYQTVVAADEYHSLRGSPATWFDASAAEKRDALRQATFYVEDVYAHRWLGWLVSNTQSLAWPRTGATDGITGQTYTAAVPAKLKEAVCEIALRILAGTNIRPDIAAGSGAVTSSSVSVGAISINDSYSSTPITQPKFPTVDSKLRGMLNWMPGSNMSRLIR